MNPVVVDDVLWADQGPHATAHPKRDGAKMNGLRPRWANGRRELAVTSPKVRFSCRHLVICCICPISRSRWWGRRPETPIALTPERPLRDPRISAASSTDGFAPLMPPEEPFPNASAVPLQHLRPDPPPAIATVLKPDRSRASRTGQFTSRLHSRYPELFDSIDLLQPGFCQHIGRS